MRGAFPPLHHLFSTEAQGKTQKRTKKQAVFRGLFSILHDSGEKYNRFSAIHSVKIHRGPPVRGGAFFKIDSPREIKRFFEKTQDIGGGILNPTSVLRKILQTVYRREAEKTHGTRRFFAARLHKISACEKLWKSHSIWKAGFQHFPQSYQQGVWENSRRGLCQPARGAEYYRRIGEFLSQRGAEN